MKKSALLLSSNFEPELIGIARYSTDLARLLIEGQFQVRVVTSEPSYGHLPGSSFQSGSIFAPDFAIHRLKSKRYGSSNLLGMLCGEISLFCYGFMRLLRTVKHHDIVIAIIPRVACGYLGLLQKCLTRRPLVIIVQDISSLAVNETEMLKNALMSKLFRRIEKLPLKYADKIVVISDRMKEFIQLEFGIVQDNLELIPNYHIQHTNKKEVHKFSRNNFSVTYTGNIGNKQEFSTLFGAANLLQNRKDISFSIFGDGSRAPEVQIQSRIYGNVTFSGLLAEWEYEAQLDNADVLFLSEKSTLRSMSLPSKLTSYLAAGKPILAVVNMESATAQFLGDSAIIVEPGNAHQLANVITELKDDELLYRKYAQASVKMYSDKLKRSDARDRYMRLFDELLQNKKS